MANAWVPALARAEVPSVRKLAMVDMQRVLNETVAGKRARKELESSFQAKQDKVNKKKTKLEADTAKAQKLTGEQLAAAQEQLQKDYMELQSMYMTLQQELAQQESRLLEKMYTNSQTLVVSLAKELGLDLVLIRDQSTVIYSQEGMDITVELVKRYNKAHP